MKIWGQVLGLDITQAWGNIQEEIIQGRISRGEYPGGNIQGGIFSHCYFPTNTWAQTKPLFVITSDLRAGFTIHTTHHWAQTKPLFVITSGLRAGFTIYITQGPG